MTLPSPGLVGVPVAVDVVAGTNPAGGLVLVRCDSTGSNIQSPNEYESIAIPGGTPASPALVVTWTATGLRTINCETENYTGDISPTTSAYIDIDAPPTAEVDCANSFDDDGDGFTDCDDLDCAANPACVMPPAEDCANGWDDDGDGDIDCDDSDCPGCACEPAVVLSCDSPSGGTQNTAPGSTDLIDAYLCSTSPTSGSEFTYDFVAPSDGEYTVEAVNLTGNLDLFLLDGSGVCDGLACIQASSTGGTADESITWTASAGESFYVVVDGVNGASSVFSIDLICPPPQDCEPSDPCCSPDGLFLPTTTVCATGLNPTYWCPDGTDPGDDLRLSTTSRRCSGFSASCDGAEWTVDLDLDCTNEHICVPGQATCDPLPCPPSAACCTPDGGYRPSTEQCAARELSWYCPEGSGPGGVVHQRRLWQYCPGDGEGCTGLEEWEAAGFYRQCSAGERCVEGEPECEAVPAGDDDDVLLPDDDDVTYERSTWSSSCVCSATEHPRLGWLIPLLPLLIRRRR